MSRKPGKIRVFSYLNPRKPIPDIEIVFDSSSPISRKSKKEEKIKNLKIANDKKQSNPLTNQLNSLHKKLSQQDIDGIFAKPVTEEIAPGYSDIINEPMDLLTIKENIRNGIYQDLDQFHDDVFLMIRNCMTYNPEESYYYSQASKLYKFFKRCLKESKKVLNGVENNVVFSKERRKLSTSEGKRDVVSGINLPIEVKSFISNKMIIPIYKSVGKYAKIQTNRNVSYFIAGNEERFGLFCDLLKQSPYTRQCLKTIIDKFGDHILSDFIRKLSCLEPSFAIDITYIKELLNSTEGNMSLINISEAPVCANSLIALSRSLQIDSLSEQTIRENSSDDNKYNKFMRLLFFYQNIVKYWPEHKFISRKHLIINEIHRGLNDIFREFEADANSNFL